VPQLEKKKREKGRGKEGGGKKGRSRTIQLFSNSFGGEGERVEEKGKREKKGTYQTDTTFALDLHHRFLITQGNMRGRERRKKKRKKGRGERRGRVNTSF